ncbi:MAG: enolase C-terminal domain-like protein [Verrucomicrobiota bacterium]
MRIELQDLNLPLMHRFAISRGGTDEVRTIWIRVIDEGVEGWGEAAAVKYKGQTRESMRATLELISHRLALTSVEKALKEWDSSEVHYPQESGALAGLNMALWDWKSKFEKRTLQSLWGTKGEWSPASSFTIGVDSPEVMSQKVIEAEQYPILKVKLGFKGDLEVFELLQAIAPHKKWRIDVNGGWGLEEAIEKSKALEKGGVELIEQPITSSHPDDFRKIQEAISIPLYLDESVDGLEDLERYRGAVQGVNLKLTKIGSLSGLKEATLQAKKWGYQVMYGCMTCSSLHIAGILPLSPLVDTLDLDGHLLLRREPFSGLVLNHEGAFRLTDQPGVGLEFDPRKL